MKIDKRKRKSGQGKDLTAFQNLLLLSSMITRVGSVTYILRPGNTEPLKLQEIRWARESGVGLINKI